MTFKINHTLVWLLLFLTMTIFYWPSFTNFFYGDDFYNVILGRADNLTEVINFFNLVKAPENFPFYRPLAIQFYFWLNHKIFGLNVVGYHLINFSFFLFSLILVYVLVKKIINNVIINYLVVFFYAFSNSHFYRLYFLAQFQEIGLTVLYLSTIIFYIAYIRTKKYKDYFFTLLFFVLGLMTKETAFTLLGIIFGIDWLFLNKYKNFFAWFKKRFFIWLPMILINAVYLFFRLVFFGIAKTNEYQFVFKLKSIFNNLLWYFLWSLGVPEDFVNQRIFDRTYLINPGLFTEFRQEGTITAILFSFFIALSIVAAILFIKGRKTKINKNLFRIIIYAFAWFLLTLSFVLFFPFHKFAYSVTLPLLGIALILAIITANLYKVSKLLFFTILSFYLIANMSANYFALKNHWTVQRAVLARSIWQYFKDNYSQINEETQVYFYDDNPLVFNKEESYPFSEEIAYALCNDKGLNFLYNTTKIETYFQSQKSLEELYQPNTDGRRLILVSSKQFFQKY